jgi:glyoxylase-like metal-dependent hydrolase (beta-lactamase superfamily II)
MSRPRPLRPLPALPLSFLLAATLAAALAGGVARAQPPAYTFVDVAPGVRAALMPAARRFTEGNVVLVALGDATVIVDGPGDPGLAKQVVAEAQRLGRPVRWVVNTHWHGDHTRANSLYVESFPGVEILGHATLVEDVPGRDPAFLAEEKETWTKAIAAAEERLAKGVDEQGGALDAEARADLEARLGRGRERLAAMQRIVPTPPTVALEGPLTLRRAGTEATLRLLPFRAHTRGDVVVHLPAAKVLLTGDLLDELPYFADGYPREWVATLDALDELAFDQVVPGHGGVHQGRTLLHTVRDLLRAVVTAADRAAAAGQGVEELRAALDLEPFRARLVTDDASGRAWEHGIPGLLERALAEAKGEV